MAVPSRGLARRWLGPLGWAGGCPAAVHGVAQASRACSSVPRSLPGHSLGGAGLRPRLSRRDSREGGRRWGKCRRGRETEGDRQDGETGRRAGRREPDGGSACSPLPPGCKAEWRLTAVRHPRTGFKVTTQISLRSGRWEECQSVTGQAGGKRGGRWVTDGWAVGGGTEGPSRGNPNPV